MIFPEQIFRETMEEKLKGVLIQTRKKEHITCTNTKTYKKGSNIATHGWLKSLFIDFNNARPCSIWGVYKTKT